MVAAADTLKEERKRMRSEKLQVNAFSCPRGSCSCKCAAEARQYYSDVYGTNKIKEKHYTYLYIQYVTDNWKRLKSPRVFNKFQFCTLSCTSIIYGTKNTHFHIFYIPNLIALLNFDIQYIQYILYNIYFF